MITEPNQLFALLAGVLALVFWASTLKPFKRLFEYVPPLIWAYFVPMFLTTAGVTPDSSEVYSWMSRYLLPLSLFLLMITVDLPAILSLGKKAIIMMLAGTLGYRHRRPCGLYGVRFFSSRGCMAGSRHAIRKLDWWYR